MAITSNAGKVYRISQIFKGGIHLPELKELASEKPVEEAGLPQEIVLPLSQHIGAPCRPLVSVGDRVRSGQKIGGSDRPVSAPVHSSVCGVVKAIEERPSLTGKLLESIIIQVDEEQQSLLCQPSYTLEQAGREQIIFAVKEAGVVGMGGATFPTAVKLSPPAGKIIDTVLINGCECEPFLNCDNRQMLERCGALVLGAKLLLKATGAEQCFFCVEDNKPYAINKLEQSIDDPRIKVAVLPSRYPQGSEKHLIKAVLGREVPSGGLPFDVGTLVQNISTTYSCYEAVLHGKPLVERVVTVTGQNIRNPANLLVKFGTPINYLINQCGGIKESPARVIVGGPMTGFAQTDLDVPVVKGTNGIVVLPAHMTADREGYLACVRCGRCVEYCSMLLYPGILSTAVEQGKLAVAEKWDALDCVECGICTYVCPSQRPNVQLIKGAKGEIMLRKQQN